MKLIPCLILCFGLFMCHLAEGQSCKKLDGWTQSVENEFPDVDFARLKSGSEMYNRIRYNLLSDKYFIPIFKKPFDELSEGRRYSINQAIKRCQPNLINNKVDDLLFKKFECVDRLDFYLWGVFTQQRAYDDVVNQVDRLRSLRSEFNKELETLEKQQLTLDELTSYKVNATSKYQLLLPSEIAIYTEKINESESAIAGNELQAKLSRLIRRANTLSTLAELSDFKLANYRLFEKMTVGQKEVSDRVIGEKIDEIFSSLNAVVRSNPESWKAYYERANAYSTIGNYNQAIVDVSKAIEVNPKVDAKSYYFRAQQYYLKKDYHRSISDLTEGIRQSPIELRFYYLRAASYFNIKDYERALTDYDRVINSSSRINSEHFYERGLCNFFLEEYHDALRDFNIVLKYEPSNAEAFYWRGNSYSKLNNGSYARRDFEQACRLNPNNQKYARAYSNHQTNVSANDILTIGVGLILLNAVLGGGTNDSKAGGSADRHCMNCGGKGYTKCLSCGGTGYTYYGTGIADCLSCTNGTSRCYSCR